MLGKFQNTVLIVAILLSIATYLFWPLFPKGSFYVGNAIFILLLAYYVKYLKNDYRTFILFWLSVGNLLDELFFDNTELHYSEIAFAVGVIIIAYFKYGRKRR